MKIADVPKISQLSIAEKILFVEELWNSIVSDKNIPVPKSHKDELDRRLLKYQNHRGHMLSLEDLQEHIEKRK